MTTYQTLRADLDAASDAYRGARAAVDAAHIVATTYDHYVAALELEAAANVAHNEAIAAAYAKAEPLLIAP